jgi:phosphate starvation-inducible membrane PsiE
MSIAPFLGKINQFILNPLILLMFAIALLVFLWGIFQFLTNTEDAKNREQGQKNMLWGVIGMFIMFGVYGIIRIVMDTIGVNISGRFPF